MRTDYNKLIAAGIGMLLTWAGGAGVIPPEQAAPEVVGALAGVVGAFLVWLLPAYSRDVPR